MNAKNLSRFGIWLNARLDRRRGLPAVESSALSPTEELIRTRTNMRIREAEKAHGQKTKPLEAALVVRKHGLENTYGPQYKRFCEETGRCDVRACFSHMTHAVLLVLLTVGEMAFNIIVFNVFREPGIVTVVCALGVMIAVPICAYHIGRTFRQHPQPWRHSLASMLTLAAVLLAVSFFRINYLQQTTADAGKGVYWQLGFIAVNLAVLVGAALVTYLSFDPVDGFEETKEKFDILHSERHGLEHFLGQLDNDLRTEVEMAKEQGWEQMWFYRAVNRRGRDQVPKYFDDEAQKNHRPPFVEVTLAQRAEEVPRRFLRVTA